MNKLTVEGLVNLLKEIEGTADSDRLERIVLFTDGSGSLKDSEKGVIKVWDSLDEMFDVLYSLTLEDCCTQTKLADKFN